ncbi:hypothetical protein BTO32_15455 [Marinobacter lutaoensis]|uniref:Toxin co-regulated pilus biosynthesis protein Q C-terminal domain-containing protein n=1 Tax=Marinobacter lutaoensis TaxID=135739 RepID=A0A1V2DPP9_9GAMM|nr:hypothetical protein [Marinobacter lutaoensis]ONF42602.1 hypothetical protein BTO32_15455 [Marinobacter lutaoensis]
MKAVKRLGLISASAASLMMAIAPTHAALEIKKSKGPDPAKQEAVFDTSEFSTWVDNTYKSVVTYGVVPNLQKSPTYGDVMPLSDALKILAPDNWKVFRARDLDLEGKSVVSWDLKEATWVDALANLGERHGFQFHIDFNRKEIFVKNGRKLIFDRPVQLGIEETYPSATAGRVFDKDVNLAEVDNREIVSAKSFVDLNDDNPDESVFTLKKGESARKVMEDLALIFGYEDFYWLIDDQEVDQTRTFVGDATQIMGQVVTQFYGRLCLYEVDKVAAVFPKNMECPTDEQK